MIEIMKQLARQMVGLFYGRKPVPVNDKPIFDAFRLLTGDITRSEFKDIKGAIHQWQEGGSDKPLFDLLGVMDDDDKISQYEFATLKRAIAASIANDNDLGVVRSESRDISAHALESMALYEGFRANAYPDPGSRDGHPWTIGFGSTGPDIRKGMVWTRRQAMDRMLQDVRRFEDGVEKAIGDAPTTQAQFDAFVHFAYNIGIAAFSRSTLLKKHKAGDYAGASREFGRWNKNDGKVMAGLTRRRNEESRMYLA